MEIKCSHKQLKGQQDITIETRKYSEVNENKNTTYQFLWDAIKIRPEGIYTCKCLYFKKKKNLKSITQHSTLRNNENKNKPNPKQDEIRKYYKLEWK